MDAARRLPIRSYLNCNDQVQASGFTLYETLIALTVVGILSAGTIGVARLVQSSRIASDVNNLIADLNLARSEAIKRGQPVTMCQSDSTTDCTGSSSWRQGWIVFADANTNRLLDDGEILIRAQQPPLPSAHVQFRGSGVGRNHYVTYWPTGFATPNGTFSFCDPNNLRNARTVILYWTGRARSSTKNAGGGPVACP